MNNQEYNNGSIEPCFQFGNGTHRNNSLSVRLAIIDAEPLWLWHNTRYRHRKTEQTIRSPRCGQRRGVRSKDGGSLRTHRSQRSGENHSHPHASSNSM